MFLFHFGILNRSNSTLKTLWSRTITIITIIIGIAFNRMTFEWILKKVRFLLAILFLQPFTILGLVWELISAQLNRYIYVYGQKLCVFYVEMENNVYKVDMKGNVCIRNEEKMVSAFHLMTKKKLFRTEQSNRIKINRNEEREQKRSRKLTHEKKRQSCWNNRMKMGTNTVSFLW